MASANSVYRMTITGKLEDQQIVHVSHWTVEGASLGVGTQQNLQDFCQEIQNRWKGNILNLLSERYETLSYKVQEITGIIYVPQGGGLPTISHDELNEQYVLETTPGVDVGAILVAAHDSFPAHVTVTTRFLTGYAGRRWRGAIRYAGIPQNVADGTKLTSAARTNFDDETEDVFSTFQSPFGGVNNAEWKPVIYSRTAAHEGYSTTPTILLYTRYINDWKTNPFCGSQNSRKINSLGY